VHRPDDGRTGTRNLDLVCVGADAATDTLAEGDGATAPGYTCRRCPPRTLRSSLIVPAAGPRGRQTVSPSTLTESEAVDNRWTPVDNPVSVPECPADGAPC
jgi:hypothetical protein